MSSDTPQVVCLHKIELPEPLKPLTCDDADDQARVCPIIFGTPARNVPLWLALCSGTATNTMKFRTGSFALPQTSWR